MGDNRHHLRCLTTQKDQSVHIFFFIMTSSMTLIKRSIHAASDAIVYILVPKSRSLPATFPVTSHRLWMMTCYDWLGISVIVMSSGWVIAGIDSIIIWFDTQILCSLNPVGVREAASIHNYNAQTTGFLLSFFCVHSFVKWLFMCFLIFCQFVLFMYF